MRRDREGRPAGNRAATTSDDELKASRGSLAEAGDIPRLTGCSCGCMSRPPYVEDPDCITESTPLERYLARVARERQLRGAA